MWLSTPTHIKPRIHHDYRGRLFVNPGETSGWTFNNPTVIILETKPLHAQVVQLPHAISSLSGSTTIDQ